MQAAGLLLGVRRRSLAEACSAYLGVDCAESASNLRLGCADAEPRPALLCCRRRRASTRRLWDKTARDLKATGSDAAYRLQHDCLPAAAAMELRGIALDLDAHAALCDKWEVDLADARRAWVEATGHPRRRASLQIRRDTWSKSCLKRSYRVGCAPARRRSAQLAKNLRKAAHLPAIRPLLRITKCEKLISSFGRKLRQFVNPETGRLHPRYNVAGTKSGRWSSSDPSIQQLPKDAETRRIIVAAPGHVLVGVDYSQMELRAAAWVSEDAELTRSLRRRASTCMCSRLPRSTVSSRSR